MDRDFAILGLREGASKEEIRAAYERRLAKYRTADYADDPDYVRRKREELKAACENAIEKAESMAFEKIREDAAEDFAKGAAAELREELTEEAAEEFAEDAAEAAQTIFKEREKLKSGRKLEYEWKKRQMKEEESGSAFEDFSFTDDRRGDSNSEEERIRRRSRKEYEREKVREAGRNRADEKTGFQKPDLSSLKGKAQQLKQYTQRRADEIKTELYDYQEREKEYSKEDENDTPMEVLNEAGESKMTSKAVLGEGFQNFEDKSTHMKNIGAVVQIIIAIVIAIAGFAMTADDDDIPEDYLYDEYTEIVYQDSDYTEDNERIRKMGYAFSSYFNSEDTVYSREWEQIPDNDENLHKAADRFVKLYADCDSMSGLCESLYIEVGAFPVSKDDFVEDQVREVLNYYGFPPSEEVIGTINPYTGKSIRNVTQYLRYLNRFYGGHFESEMF